MAEYCFHFFSPVLTGLMFFLSHMRVAEGG